jgi:hypothetical protein
VLAIAETKKLLLGKTVGVDSTMLEANAAMKSIVRRDTGEDWKEYVARLMKEEGVIEKDHKPTDEEVRRYDKQRKNKKVSNEDWVSESDPESQITQMKDGRTHLAYKAEHVVDLKTDLVLAAEIRPATAADTATMVDSVVQAQVNLEQAASDTKIEEVTADKGYHAANTLELSEFVVNGARIVQRSASEQAPGVNDLPADHLDRQRICRDFRAKVESPAGLTDRHLAGPDPVGLIVHDHPARRAASSELFAARASMSLQQAM